MDTTLRTCRVCGCWDGDACAEGCYWVALDLCSACAGVGELAAAGVRASSLTPEAMMFPVVGGEMWDDPIEAPLTREEEVGICPHGIFDHEKEMSNP